MPEPRIINQKLYTQYAEEIDLYWKVRKFYVTKLANHWMSTKGYLPLYASMEDIDRIARKEIYLQLLAEFPIAYKEITIILHRGRQIWGAMFGEEGVNV